MSENNAFVNLVLKAKNLLSRPVAEAKEGLKIEQEAFVSLQDVEDALEGVSAFIEKRQAQFSDR